MTFSIVFWNIWFEAQVNGDSCANSLLDELDNLVDRYNPDIIGLNEVARRSTDSEPFVLDRLKKYGYKYRHFAGSRFTTKDWGDGRDWELGTALVSRCPLENIENIILGEDALAVNQDIHRYTVKAIGASIQLNSKNKVNVIVAHPYPIKLKVLKTHWRHQNALREAINRDQYQSVIIGGDFNEPNILPGNFTRRENKRFFHRTGNFRNPTWRHKASKRTPLRLSLDKIFWSKNSNIELLDFKVLHSEVSDHSPILGRFEIR